MLSITPISALQTNYIWVITSTLAAGKAVIIDPGAAQPVLDYLQQHHLELAAILVTHHHADHTNGLKQLLQYYPCPVYAGATEPINYASNKLTDGENFVITALNLKMTAIHLPGHTKGHTAFYGHNMLFSGDTLFAAGCGRNFEGSYEQLYHSLQKLATLPTSTQIYCGHEYTAQNLCFGAIVEKDNTAITDKLKLVTAPNTSNKCTLPSNLAEELATNVFLRCHLPQVQAAASRYAQQILSNPVSVFATLREWKNNN